ncbi:hypothetical protein TNCV_3107191 [Trichonephila clavipes]|nr:hypothetical protein TNCV_3107191 [Trichonephila clavipes]
MIYINHTLSLSERRKSRCQPLELAKSATYSFPPIFFCAIIASHDVPTSPPSLHMVLGDTLYTRLSEVRAFLSTPIHKKIILKALSSIKMRVQHSGGGGGDKVVVVITGNGVDRVDTGDSA